MDDDGYVWGPPTFPSRRAGGDPLWGATEAYSGGWVGGGLDRSANRIEWEIRWDENGVTEPSCWLG